MTTVADVVTTVRALADAQPNRIESCSYVRNDKPVCIIGEALVATGTSVDILYKLIGSIDPLLLTQAGVDYDAARDRTKVNWLSVVQSNQDSGYAWGDAVAFADVSADHFGWSV